MTPGHPRSTEEGPALQRREALTAAAGTALALGLAACSRDEDDEDELGPEAEALGELAALEQGALRAYELGVRFSEGRQARTLERLAGQSGLHLEALGRMLSEAGGPGIDQLPEPEPIFVRDQETALRAARVAARPLPAAYIESIPGFVSAGQRIELMTILGNDAEHLVVLDGVRAPSPLREEDGGSGG